MAGPTMWRQIFEVVGPITGSAGAAVLSTIVTRRLSSRQSEFCSEILCWMTLPVLFKMGRLSDTAVVSRGSLTSNLESARTSSSSLWIVAGSLAIACSYQAEMGTIMTLPALTPLLLVAERCLQSDSQIWSLSDPSTLSTLAHTIWGTVLTASIAIFAMSDWNLLESALSIVPVAALLIVYIALLPRTIGSTHFLPRINIREGIIPLSSRVIVILVVALGMQATAFGPPIIEIAPTLSLGLAKALSWYYTTRITRYASWRIATAIATFSIVSNCDPSVGSSEVQALSQVVGSVLSLNQIVHMLPKQTKARSILWFFVIVSLAPYVANIIATRIALHSVPPSFGHSREHPVEALVQNAQIDFKHLLHQQSRNYTAAHSEYRRRYAVEPPPGFEAWYDFAAANHSPIIDDFDTIFVTISPLWRLSGKEVAQMVSEVLNVPNVDLWRCSFSTNSAKTYCSHPYRVNDRQIGLLFNNLLRELGGALPDTSFLVNHLDEPRVLAPPPSHQAGTPGTERVRMTDLARRPVWDAITRFCPSLHSPWNARGEQKVETFGLPFVTNRSLAMDICRHPEYSDMHGLFISPTSFRLIEGLVPILSTGSPSTMGDLLMPSPAYKDSAFRYDDTRDIPWERKMNNLYWAGSTTGGFASDGLWSHYHRQRFVKLAQNLDHQQHSYLREKGGVVRRTYSSFLNGRLFDVFFTRIFQCERIFCRAQRAFFRVRTWADKDQALRSRLVFDTDGNGISGRYYKLLASRSAPLKQTLFREWHDDRLVPWVHFIPVSQSLEEVPELVFYLTSTESGQQRAKEIAEQGRDWYTKAIRDVDLTIYTYRLLLELARLQDPSRQAS